MLFVLIQIILLVSSMIIPSIYQSADNIHSFYELIEIEIINVSLIARVGAYMIGYNMGIVFFEFRKSQEISQSKIYKIMAKRRTRVFIVLSSFSILGLMACFVSNENLNELTFSNKVWLNSFHFLFPLTVCILISPPLFGFSSWFKRFLEYSKFGLLSKMSLSAYGVHFIVQFTTIYSRKTDLYLNNM